MNSNLLQGCCAVRVAYNFGHTTQQFAQPSKEEIIEYLNSAAKLAKMNGESLLLVTINSHQRNVMMPILRKLKFKKLEAVEHRNHRTTVYLYRKKIPQD